MANIKKGARAYYTDTDYRRDGMNEAYSKIDSMPSIPTPTAEDVGKVVKATENGDYTLAQDAGAKELVVTIANDFTADKTYTEILTALNNGDIVKVIDWIGRNYFYSGMTSTRISFAYIEGHVLSSVTDVFTLAVDNTNSWELYLDDITHLPTVTSADTGKVLTVDSDGAWGADNVPSELPSHTSSDAGKVLSVDSNNYVVWERRNVIIEDLDYSNNAYVLTKNATCTDLWTKVGECINNGIIPYLMIQGKQILPCINYQNTQGNQNTKFGGYTNTYQTTMYFKECIIPNSNTNIVTVTTRMVNFT